MDDRTAGRCSERVAVVTGGGSGIGRATVLRLLEEGAQVVIADVNGATAQETLDLARRAGLDARAVVARTDIRSEDDVAAMIETAVGRFGQLDVLVNNAGIGGAFGPVTEVEGEDWDFTFDVLARGAFYGIKHAARVMTAGSSIVNVGSIAAFCGSFASIAYAAAKGAVSSLTRAAAVELAAQRIRVNVVCPGAIRTPLLESGSSDDLDQVRPPGQPWPEWGRPDDIAAAIVYLAGTDSEFVTGQTLVVDGGLTAAGPGPDFLDRLGTDPRTRGLVGVNRGMTGQPSEVRRRLT